ncbi:MAG TPA: 3-hydroxyacyl-CoA dehydrogenase NAD-binding domain-containing protein [Saprospiraceae bacterium]|nr:3-hydroxyacyl-CoA dehydrogenase NAD-binding domain-containing protein [Saprospiraceae bacterium]
MIKYQKDTDHIVTLTLDMNGRTHNVINHEIGDLFLPVLQHLKEEKLKGTLRGVILTSGKKTFLSGGDWEYLYRADDAQEIFAFTEKLKQFLRDLESPGVPVVAAINGTALGTGFEVALACHHRIAIAAPDLHVGLPEVRIGLMPGAGGIVRLMWLLGLEKAFMILSSGRHYTPQEAITVGIIDELAKNRKDMLAKAKAWLLRNPEGRRPWDREHCTIPGGTMKELRVARVVQQLAAQLTSRGARFPAAKSILNVLAESSKMDFDTACRIESRYYTALLRSRETKNQIKALWFDHNFIAEGKNRPRGFGKFRPKKIGVIGAGQMGSGIAFTCIMSGMEVVLKDVSKSIAERGREFVSKRLQELLEQGQLPAAARTQILEKLRTTDTSKDFEHCDLVIEAVFENRNLKQKVIKEAEEYMDEYAVFGGNTVSIPITRLAETSARPENYVGLHFFHPAEEVPLVEIVRGERTSEETTARAFDFVRAIGKTPIIVKDDWGFYAARVQNTFILEGITMLQEGYPPALIENTGQQAGMPKGALAFADDLGLDLVLRYEQQAAEHYGAKYIQHPAVGVLTTMLEKLQRVGKAKKAGFYEYDDAATRRLWIGLHEYFPTTQQPFDNTELAERFLFAQVIEAVWCLQEGVIESSAAANLGSIYGWGFPASKGGVIQYIRSYGVDAFLERCKDFQIRYGQRFQAPRRLREIALSD